MKIVMIGAGYVGLVTGACFAEFGFEVVCVDNDPQKIEALENGKIPIYEPGLDSLVAQGVQKKRLSFTTNLRESVKDADVIMIAVGTPSRRGDGHADLSYVFAAVEEVAAHLKDYTVIVTKSTVPVGTGDRVADIIKTARPDLQEGVHFDVASNPEFLREGSAINDFMRPDRVVVGTDSEHAQEVMQRLYRPLYLIETPILFTNRPSAELIKYAANGFLALKIAFINQMADLCEMAGGDVQDLAKGMGLDNRIGRKFLNVSPGYGGSCFPKDTKALARTAHELNAPCTIIDAVIEANDSRKLRMATRIVDCLKKRNFLNTANKEAPHEDTTQTTASAPKVAILGLTFKPNTDDIRDAASLVIIPELIRAGVNISLYDPLYFKDCERLATLKGPDMDWVNQINFASSTEDAIKEADAVVILTEWNEFRGINLSLLHKTMNPCQGHAPLLIDYRNIFKANDVREFEYISLGRPDYKQVT